MKKVKYLLLSSLLFVCACSEKSEQVDPLLSLETCSVKGYGVSLEVRCDIFQFEEPAKDSPEEKINKIIFAEFADYENFILTRFREYTNLLQSLSTLGRKDFSKTNAIAEFEKTLKRFFEK